MNIPISADLAASIDEREARGLAKGALIGLWVYPIWLVFAGVMLVGGQSPGLDVLGTRIEIPLLFIVVLWIWQVLAVGWMGWFLQNSVRTTVAIGLQLNPLLGAVGMGFMIAAAYRKLRLHRLRLTLFGISPEEWREYLARANQRCKSCGEPRLPASTVCPLCGAMDTESPAG